MARVGLIAWLAVLVVAAVVCGTRMRMTTSIVDFVGSQEERERAQLVRALSESELARTIVLTVEHADLDVALGSAEELAEVLSEHEEIAWVRDRVDPELERTIYDLYFPRRFAFALGDPDAEVEARFSDERLDEDAKRLLEELRRPSGAAIKRIAAEDPWMLFVARMRTLQAQQAGAVELRKGRLVARSGEHAIVFAGTHHSPLSSAHQAPLEAVMSATIERLQRDHGVAIERSSVHRIALDTEQSIRTDIQRISIISSLAVLVLLGLLLGSVRLLLLAFAPLVGGVLVATATLLVTGGQLHGLTLAFGATLIGVCIDYPAHVLTHRLAGSGALSRVWPGLWLGSVTTIAGFAGLTATGMPAVQEIGLFASVGVGAAMVTTRLVLPPLIGTPKSASTLRWLADHAQRFVGSPPARRWLWAAPAAALLCLGLGLTQVQWVDDAAMFAELRPALLQEDERVRHRVARTDLGRVVVSVADDEEAALAVNDAVASRLAPLADEGLAVRSVHAFVRSAALQRRSDAAVRRVPELASRTRDALGRAGFRPEAFADLESVLAAQPSPVLTFESLAETPLRPTIAPFRLDLDGRVAVVTYVGPQFAMADIDKALEGLDGVLVLDQLAFMERTYAAYRLSTLPLLAVGLALVAALLLARYRSPRRAAAAFLPAILAAGACLGVLALAGVRLHLLHLVGLLLVLSIGVDYGVFLAEGAGDRARIASTLLALVVACLTTVLSFGLLALSATPALAAVGLTTSIGVFLSLVLAPSAHLVLARRSDSR